MRFGNRYDKKKGPKRPFKKSGKSKDASATVLQVYTNRLTAAAIGSATFPGVQGTAILTGVLYVPGLHKNLISVPKLISVSLMDVKKYGSFYVTEFLAVVTGPSNPETVEQNERKVRFANVMDAKNLWHQRFAHLGTKAVVAISKNEVVLGIPKLEEEVYRKSLPSSDRHFSKPCKSTHMDTSKVLLESSTTFSF